MLLRRRCWLLDCRSGFFPVVALVEQVPVIYVGTFDETFMYERRTLPFKYVMAELLHCRNYRAYISTAVAT